MRVDNALLRRMAYWGARYGPRPFAEHSPRLLGLGFALGLPEARRHVRYNLRLALGERHPAAEGFDIARTFMNYAACLSEAMGAERSEARSVRIRIDGRDRLEAVLAQRRGVVLLTAHVGPFEAAARYFVGRYGVELMVVMQKEEDPDARDFHDRLRQRLGVRVAHVGDHALDALPLLEHLQRGGVVAIQLDRMPAHSRDLDIRVFGQKRRLPAGPFRLAALCGAPLLSVFARRRAYFDYELSIGEPVWLSREGLKQELFGVAQRFGTEMERAILRDPTQWFHFEPPPGDA